MATKATEVPELSPVDAYQLAEALYDRLASGYTKTQFIDGVARLMLGIGVTSVRSSEASVPAVACIHDPLSTGQCVKCGTWTAHRPNEAKPWKPYPAADVHEGNAAKMLGVLAYYRAPFEHPAEVDESDVRVAAAFLRMAHGAGPRSDKARNDDCEHPVSVQQKIQYELIMSGGHVTVGTWCGSCGSLLLGGRWHKPSHPRSVECPETPSPRETQLHTALHELVQLIRKHEIGECHGITPKDCLEVIFEASNKAQEVLELGEAACRGEAKVKP